MTQLSIPQAIELATAHHRAGRLVEAAQVYQQILTAQPQLLDVARMLADAQFGLGQLDHARLTLLRVTTLDPTQARDHNNLGIACQRLNRYADAIASFRRACERDPNRAEARYSLGVCASAGGDWETGIACMRETLRLKPDHRPAHESLLQLLHYNPAASAQSIFDEHVAWAKQFANAMPTASHDNDRDPNRRLRIGYLSPHFRRHSVAYFFEPLLGAHDRAAFETFCYADEISSDSTTARLRSQCDHWRNITGKPDEHVANLIRRDHIDLLVDLAGHSENHRLLAMARKPAPVQFTYLGYPDTTGLTAIDYRLTDAIADPADAFSTETLERIYDCTWCYRPDDSAPLPAMPADGRITFGCFNIAAKINRPLVETWAAILRRVPGSHMLIKTGTSAADVAHPRIRQMFADAGIDASRIELLAYVPDTAAHLQLYNRVHVALDTFPYNGTTTTCEALWMGVSVVTQSGQTHCSRVGASLLTDVGLPELIASSSTQYIDLAISLAADSKRLAELRNEMRERMRLTPLMNAPHFARRVEAIYRKTWAKWCASA